MKIANAPLAEEAGTLTSVRLFLFVLFLLLFIFSHQGFTLYSCCIWLIIFDYHILMIHDIGSIYFHRLPIVNSAIVEIFKLAIFLISIS